jgi:hypothetical protein
MLPLRRATLAFPCRDGRLRTVSFAVMWRRRAASGKHVWRSLDGHLLD